MFSTKRTTFGSDASAPPLECPWWAPNFSNRLTHYRVSAHPSGINCGSIFRDGRAQRPATENAQFLRTAWLPKMYNARAVQIRRCRSFRADGEACRSWAAWDDLHQRCAIHAGRHHRGYDRWVRAEPEHARYPPCECSAYNWPHRPGGGRCEWPLVSTAEMYKTN
jgi:hypothetical protein